MKKQLITILALLLAAFAIVKCDKELPEPPYPRVETLPVEDISSKGATFHGRISLKGDFEVIRYGFSWSLLDRPLTTTSDYVVFDGPLNGDAFSAVITSTLEESEEFYAKRYKVRAFIETESYKIYGPQVEFRSLGSLPPTITTYHPSTGTYGDTLTIVGSKFSNVLDKNEVNLGLLRLHNISASDTLLKCVIPSSQNSQTVKLSVTVAGNKGEATELFNYKGPDIADMAPIEAAWADTVRIMMHLYYAEDVKVTFNAVQAPIVSKQDNYIDVIVPNEIGIIQSKITVLSRGITDEWNGFKLKQPVITGVLPVVLTKPGQTVTITGDNLNADKRYVTIDADPEQLSPYRLEPAQILSADRHKIVVKIDARAFTSLDVTFVGNLMIKVGFQNAIAAGQVAVPIDYQSIWTKKNDFPGVTRNDAIAFSANGKGYFGTGRGGVPLGDFWQYDPSTDQWNQLDDFPGHARAGAVAFSIGDVGYVGLGTNYWGGPQDLDHYKDFYRYDTNTGSWAQLADLPGVGRHSAAAFVINDVGYVGTGWWGQGGATGMAVTNEFWKYDTGTNLWATAASFPNETYTGGGFNINEVGYVYDYNNLFRFNGSSWETVDNVPALADRDGVAFSIGNSGFFGLGLGTNSLIRYTSNTGLFDDASIWISRPGASTLVIGNKAYVVYLKEVWEFDPSKKPQP